MPRRPPARVRAQQRRTGRQPGARRIPEIPRASGALRAAITRLEHADARFSHGAIAQAFHTWLSVNSGPCRRAHDYALHADCEYCNPPGREVLDLALHCLPRRHARELRLLVAPIDDRFLQRTVQLPSKPPGPWWTRRC